MTDDHIGGDGRASDAGDLIEIDLNFESMRRFQAEFSPNLSADGLFIDTGEPLDPGSVVRFRVILPEDFVFLEGTAVVEWRRGAEAVADGPPGMALRFVTLSPQNQELVEQLVQDFVDAGGTPFDLDVQPVLDEFPTDALEGAPPPPEPSPAEGYRLTVRRTGPDLKAEARDAVPAGEVSGSPEVAAETSAARSGGERGGVGAAEGGGEPVDEPGFVAPVGEAPAVEEHGFELVDSARAAASAAGARAVAGAPGSESGGTVSTDGTETSEQDTATVVGEAPEIDWDAEEEVTVEAAELGVPDRRDVVAPPKDKDTVTDDERGAMLPKQLSFATSGIPEKKRGPSVDDQPTKAKDDEAATGADEPTARVDDDLLETPEDFADGPEVIDDVSDDSLVGQIFNVSLPEHDDEPDTTPVIPDEGRDDVTITDDDEPTYRKPRRWPYFLAAAFVVAVVVGVLSPRVRVWLEDGGAGEEATEAVEAAASADAAATDLSPVGGLEGGLDSQQIVEEQPPAADDGEPLPDSGDDARPAGPTEPTATATAAPTPIPTPTPRVVPVTPATSVVSIDAEPADGGTAIRIRGDGVFADGAITVEGLSSPPRILIRIRGIEDVFRPYTIEADTAEVAQIRIGHHEDRRPPELWVVLDLARAGVTADQPRVAGDRLEVLVSKR